MIIGVAGPYSAPFPEERQANLDRMNTAAARLLEMGHTPLIGMNAALPVLEVASVTDNYGYIMRISLAVINACEALLFIGESPGALREKELISSKGLPVYYSVEDVPPA